jgi:hypothetical protein
MSILISKAYRMLKAKPLWENLDQPRASFSLLENSTIFILAKNGSRTSNFYLISTLFIYQLKGLWVKSPPLLQPYMIYLFEEDVTEL